MTFFEIIFVGKNTLANDTLYNIVGIVSGWERVYLKPIFRMEIYIFKFNYILSDNCYSN